MKKFYLMNTSLLQFVSKGCRIKINPVIHYENDVVGHGSVHTMKNLVIFLALFLLSFSGAAQPFLGMQANNAGAGLITGYQLQFDSENIYISGNSLLVSAGVTVPYNKEEKFICHLTAGYVYSFGEQDAFSISAHVGAALHTYTKFSMPPESASQPLPEAGPLPSPETEHAVRDESENKIPSARKITPYYSIEIGKDLHLGRLFINASYADRKYFGAGFRVFLK